MKIKIKKLNEDSKIPTYSHEFDAGMDLYAHEETEVFPFEVVKIKTGISMHIPDGFVGLIWDKSGLACRNSIKVVAGVVDATYRGEILVGLTNIGKDKYVFKKGDKVAQMLIQKVEQAEFDEVSNLEETGRGSGGFGSTGV